MAEVGRPIPDTEAVPPLVSVVVPAYNSARTIERCMGALAAQRTSHRFEVLVVHSGTDDTCTLAARALAGTRVLQLPERAIPPRARNIGVQHARGDILAFIDSDIYVDPTWVEQVVKAMATGYDLVCGSIENANPHSAVGRAEQLLMFNEFLPDQPEHPSWFALSGNTALRRTTFERFGPFVAVRAAEDVVFSRRLVAAGGRILFFPELRVRHDNRTRLWPFLRNQMLVGTHTAIARRLVDFADSRSYALFLASLPVAPFVKLAKIVAHVGRYDWRQLRAVGRDFPTLMLGVFAYSAGLVRGALTLDSSRAVYGNGSTESSVGAGGPPGPESPDSMAPISGAEPAHGR
jgi:glycosyltransferase involved in cell wall biosynthesis